jgi:hypothetical protein
MRVSSLGIVVGLICFLGLTSPASAGGFPAPPPQCGGYQNIINYYAGQNFTGAASIKECDQLCKKSASECKDNVAKATKCSKKAVSDAAGTERKLDCGGLTGAEKKSCKQGINDEEDASRQVYKDAGSAAKDDCIAIRDACISTCED